MRWQFMKSEAAKYGIQIMGFSSDGDPHLLKAMKIEAGFVQEIRIPHWCHIHIDKNDLYFIQDTTHVVTKLKTRVLKPNILLPMGNFVVNADHLYILTEMHGKDEHFLTKSDLILEDKMNYESGRKLCHPRIMKLLSDISDSAATIQYLKLMNFMIESFIEKEDNLEARVHKIWYNIFFLRFWRKWIIDYPNYTLKENFITLNTFTCIELNGHMLIKINKLFKKILT